MAQIEVSKTELVWPGKYNEDGTRREVERVNLPFQIIETVNESRASREAKRRPQTTLFDVWEGKEGETFEEGWRNKLIWGDNLLVMGSLLEKFAGKVDLIYIDPPFATGADFSFITEIGDAELDASKEASLIEEKAYRDTWGRGIDSYLDMIWQRLILMYDLLSQEGSLFVHLDETVASHVRVMLDELFGADCFINEITWKRSDAHSDIGQGAKHLGKICDTLLYYSRMPGGQTVNMEFTPLPQSTAERWYRHVEEGTGRRYNKADITGPGGARKGNPVFDWKGITRAWRFGKERMEELEREGRIVYSQSGMPYLKRYLDESKGVPLQDLWDDIKMIRGIHTNSEYLGYKTQKPEALVRRIINLGTGTGDLVADFFCGSGTTLAVAEKLGRRWIGCDLSRWAIHVTRKRLLGIEGCSPFEVLNLGKYERKYWQGVTFGDKKKDDQQLAIFQYLGFILKLYGAEPLAGMQHLHGKKGKAVVHAGAVDAPVTIDEINACIEECLAVKQSELHILGWEWEMGLANLMVQEAKRRGVKLLLLNIPREVMEQQAVEKGDIRFFEVAHLEVEIKQEKGRKVTVGLKDFAFPYADLIPEDVRSKIKKWSDYLDYWAVDWNFQNDTFMNGWVAYRTRKERTLPLKTDPYAYDKLGKYAVMVKVVDIFGNDTSQAFEVEVK
jgi:DNA modification methylase